MLAITTCRAYPQPPQNLLPLAAELEQRSIATQFDVWQNAPQTPFVLPLCAWDYAAEAAAFTAWIRTAAARGQTFFNPPDLMLWNMDKRYLIDLAARGVNVIPSVYMPSESERSEFRPNGQNLDVQRIMQENNWTAAVVKPAVGQSGKGVRKIRLGESLGADVDVSDGLMVQPYIREIEQAGETSLVFFGGAYSHAVRRQPPQGEWRANSAYGVEIRPENPPDAVIQTAETALRTLPKTPLYARVDGTVIGGTLLLNELELIEPALYLHTCSRAAARFAEAVEAQIEEIRSRA
ncbi:ATP-grasp domain-containing protein [Neisseria sp. CCUG12390]|uniref:ATP-grasp domain-containing protein n=1 Tax=Neisseria sp. CCUG12390 TaxID=3392035 RepID=UPI003A0FC43D